MSDANVVLKSEPRRPQGPARRQRPEADRKARRQRPAQGRFPDAGAEPGPDGPVRPGLLAAVGRRPRPFRTGFYESGARVVALACRAAGIDRSVFTTVFNLSRQARSLPAALTGAGQQGGGSDLQRLDPPGGDGRAARRTDVLGRCFTRLLPCARLPPSQGPFHDQVAFHRRARRGRGPRGSCGHAMAMPVPRRRCRGGAGRRRFHAADPARFTGKGKPIYGMNRGTVGFLMNEYHQDDLPGAAGRRREGGDPSPEDDGHTPIARDRSPRLQRSLAAARNPPGRQDPHPGGRQAAHLRTDLRWRAGFHPGRLHRLQSFRPWPDPADRRRPAGADPDLAPSAPGAGAARSCPTAPRCGSRFWKASKRPVSAVADDFEVRDVTAVDVAEDRSISMTMLYDAGHNLDERILAEQFSD